VEAAYLVNVYASLSGWIMVAGKLSRFYRPTWSFIHRERHISIEW